MSANAYKLSGVFKHERTFMSLCHQGQRDINEINWHWSQCTVCRYSIVEKVAGLR